MMVPAFYRLYSSAYVMREGGYWQAGRPPAAAPVVAVSDGRVYDSILRDLGYSPWRTRPPKR